VLPALVRVHLCQAKGPLDFVAPPVSAAWSVVETTTHPMATKVQPARRTSPERTIAGSGPVTRLPSAGPSTVPTTAPGQLRVHTATNAASVDLRNMGLRNAQPLLDDIFPIVTSFKHEVWSMELHKANAPVRFLEVPKGLQFGFTVGLQDFTLTATFSPPNHASSSLHEEFLYEKYSKEILLGRISQGYEPDVLESLIGPYRTAPLGVTDSAGKLRVIVDHSFPDGNSTIDISSLPLSSDGKRILNASTTSINSITDLAEFTCDWGSFSECWLLVADAPEGTQAAVFDVESAFRNLPLHPSIRRFLAVRFHDKIHIDHCLNFGHSPSPGVWGLVADAMAWILKHHGVEALLKWVDDFVFFRYPKSRLGHDSWSYSYDESLLFSVANLLGWPWSPEKCFPFSFTFNYIGFSWDLRHRTVQLPLKKKEKYLLRIESWVPEVKHTVKEVEKLIGNSFPLMMIPLSYSLGTFNHVCLVVPLGRSHLPPLYRFRASFGTSPSRFLKRTPPAEVLESIEWWRAALHKEFLGLNIFRPPPPSNHKLYVDASSSWGIGLVLDGKWLAWEYKPGWYSEGREIGWAEMVAVNLAVATLISSHLTNITIVGFTDNQGVHGALKAGFSRGTKQNEILRRIVQLMQEYNVWLSWEWVPSADNLADGPSRGIFPPRKLIYGYPPSVPPHLRPFINNHVVHTDPRLSS
jgi:hypothetical protein